MEAIGSLIAAELKGDLRSARTAAEASLTEAEAAGNPAAVGSAWLRIGIVATLQGDARRGESCFDAAMPALSGSDAQLAGAMRRLAQRDQHSDSPSGWIGPSLELSLRENPLAEPSPEVRDATAALVESVLVSLPWTRRQIETLAVTDPAEAAARLDEALAELVPADVSVPDDWRAYPERAGADLCRRAGQRQRGQEKLDEAAARYEALSDRVGVGACLLDVGDWHVAGLSTPLAWDLALQEAVTDAGELDWRIEAREQAPGVDLAAGRDAYRRAAEQFDGAGAPRAVAALDVRLGYVALLEGDLVAARERAKAAWAQFERAGDSRGAWVAAAHDALASVAADGAPGDEETAAAIGSWGAGDGSFAFALGIGLLFERAGRHWDVRARDTERALAAHGLAQALFEALGAGLNAQQAIVARARLHRRVGDWSTALPLYIGALSRGEPAPSAPAHVRLQALLRELGILWEQYQLATAAGDPRGFEALLPARDSLVEHMQAVVGDVPHLAPAVELAAANTEQWHVEVPVLVPLLRALAAERGGRERHAAIYREETMAAAAGRGLIEVIALDALGERDRARTLYLELLQADTATSVLPPEVPELQLQYEKQQLASEASLLVRLEAWPEADARHKKLETLDSKWWEGLAQPWSALDERAQVHEALAEYEQALKTYEGSIAAIEWRTERLTLDALRVAQANQRTFARPFQHAARAAMAASRAAPKARAAMERRALEYAERGRARSLLSLMNANGDLARSPPAREWREVGARLALTRQLLAAAQVHARPGEDDALTDELATRVRDGEAELERIEATLTGSRPGWRELVAPEAPVLSLEQVADRLEPGSLLIQYAFLERDLLAWAVTRDGVVRAVSERRDMKALARAIAHFWHACSIGRAGWEERAQPVADALLRPFAAELGACTDLMVVPSGPAHRLPFTALSLNGSRLLDTHDVSVLPSASALKFDAASEGMEANRVLALGGPTGMTYRPLGHPAAGKWEDLEWTAACAAFAAGLFPGSVHLLGAEATEANLDRDIGSFPLVLLATHAEVEPAPPRAYVVLAGGDGLELYELLGLDLRQAQLVFLAACETAGGSVTGGDEVMGLTRGLLAAGASRALLTLWKVLGDSSPLFVRALFLRLRNGERPPAAVRGAQRDIAALDEETAREQRAELREAAAGAGYSLSAEEPSPNDWGHPQHWAPYVLIGR